MANCNKLFCDFNKNITPTAEQMNTMKKSRVNLEGKITKKFEEKLGVTPTYYTQGSGAPDMKTIIVKEDGTYDADRGVYVKGKPEVKSETVQGYVYDAVNDHTADGAQHRKKCIRVIYQAAYNIDFPVYYEDNDDAYIAVKGNGWVRDAPWEMITWFKKLKDEDGQLIRIIKFLKAWASKCSQKMPSGIALTVWAARNFANKKGRDDESLYEVLKSIQLSLSFGVTCYSPVEPFDDLVAKLSDDQKVYFTTELNKFITGAKKALDEPNQLKASKIWIKYLGDRFPEGLDEDTEKREALLMESASLILGSNANLNKAGNVNSNSGVKHQIHRNYGG